MLIPHKGHTDTIQVYSVTVMTHVKALQAGHSSQGTSEPITPELTAHNYHDGSSLFCGYHDVFCKVYHSYNQSRWSSSYLLTKVELTLNYGITYLEMCTCHIFLMSVLL